MIGLSAIHDLLVTAGFFPEANGLDEIKSADKSAVGSTENTPQDYEIGE